MALSELALTLVPWYKPQNPFQLIQKITIIPSLDYIGVAEFKYNIFGAIYGHYLRGFTKKCDGTSMGAGWFYRGQLCLCVCVCVCVVWEMVNRHLHSYYGKNQCLDGYHKSHQTQTRQMSVRAL